MPKTPKDKGVKYPGAYVPSVSNIAINEHHLKSVGESPESTAEPKEKIGRDTRPANSLGGAGTFHILDKELNDTVATGEGAYKKPDETPALVGSGDALTHIETGCPTSGFHGRSAMKVTYEKYTHKEHTGADVRVVNSTCLVTHGVHYYTMASGKENVLRDYAHDAIGSSRENRDKPVADWKSLETDTGDHSATYDIGVYGPLTGHNHNGCSCLVEPSSKEDGSAKTTCCVEILEDHPVIPDRPDDTRTIKQKSQDA